jgi:hypothetical protein
MGWARKNLGVELNPITVVKSAGRKIDDEILQPVGRRSKGIVKSVADVGRKIDDEVFQPVKEVGRKIDDEILQPVKEIAKDPKAIAAIALAVAFPGAGAALGAQLGLSGVAAQVVGQALINTAFNGGDVKAAVLSAALPVLGGPASAQISETIGKAGIDGALNRVVTNAVVSGATAAVLNQDMSTALVSSLVKSAPAIVSQYVPQFAELPRAVQEVAISATADLLRTGGDNLQNIALTGVANAATDYAVKSIPGYSDLRPGQKEVVRNGVSNILQGKNVTTELLNGAMSFGQEAVQNEINENRAKDAGWADYKTQQAAKSMYGNKVTPDLYADKQNTTEDEAKQFARQILGREPTEFEYMQLIGLPEQEAAQNSDLSAIKYDESTFDSGELAQAYKAVYGKEPTAEWLASDEAMDMLGRSDAQGKNLLNEFYTKDKNWVTEDEAEQFWKGAGNKGSMPQSFMDELLITSETGAKAMAETYRIRKDDLDATTFDGTKYKDQKEAQAAAIKDGYSNYTFGDKNYYLMSPDQAEALKKDIAAGKTAGPKPDVFFTSVPGMSLEQQLEAAGNPDSYAYMQGDVIHIVAKRLPVPDYNDLEAWNDFKEEKKAAGGDNFQSFLTEQFSILEQAMKGAPKDSIAKVVADAAMFGYGKMAQVVEAFSRTGEAMGVPQAERGTNIAKQVQSWSKKLVDQGIQNAEAAVLANVAAVTKESIAAERGVKPSDISTAELYAQKTAALFKQVPNNPLGVSLFLAGEGIQEIPLLAVSGGVGSVFKNVIGKSVGLSAAVGTNVALNGAESFGGNYGEVKEYLTKQGVPASQIEALAVKSGLEGMAVGMLTSYVGDRALVKSFMGDLATDSFGKVVATNSTKEWFLGNFEGSLQNMSAQIGKYGSIKSEDEWLNAGIMEGFAQKGIAAGVLTADGLSKVVAKDYDGKPVTLKQVIDGEKTFDPKTIDKSFNYGTGVNLGDAIGYHTTFLTNPDITPDEYFYTAQTFRQNGMTDFTPQEIASIVGGAGELSSEQVAKAALPYAQERVVTKEEAQQMMRDLGYTNMTDAEAMSLAGQISETAARDKVTQYVDPRQVTRSEAEKFFESIPGYKPTEADITAFMRQGANVNQEAVRGEIGAYVDPRMVDEQEAKDAYAALGLKKPTQADILKLVGQYDETGLTGKATDNLDAAKYNSIINQIEQLGTQSGADPAALDAIKKDINSQIAALGGDVSKLQSGVDSVVSEQAKTKTQIGDLQANLSAEIQAAKDIGLQGDAALQAGLDSLSEKMGVDQAALLTQLGTTAADLKTQFAADIAASQTATATEIANTKTALETAIANAKASGLEGDAALKAAIDSVAAGQKTSSADLLTKLGTTEAGLKSEFAAGLAGVSAEVTDTRKALEDAIQAAKDIGLQGDAALQAGIDSVASQLGTTKDALLGKLGTTEETLRTEFATGITSLETQMKAQYETLTAAQKSAADALVAQGRTLQEAITAAKTETAGQIANVETRLTDAIAAAEAMGLSRDQAITAAVESVAADLGTTKAELLTQLGTTEETLRTEFTTGLAGVSAEVKAAYDSLTADQKALADQLAQQGVDLTTAIQTAQAQTAGQIGELTADVQAKYDALTAEQKALANQLTQQGVDLNTAIATAQQQTQQQITNLGVEVDARINQLMQQGQTYQQATQQAFAEVNAKNQEMAGLIGTQGRAASQQDIDALNQMLGGQRSMDLAYDVTGDKQITQADIDFLTQVVGGTNTDWKAPVGSAFGPTGLYGQLAANEAQRQADLQAQLAREQAAEQARAAQATQAATRARQANIRTTATQAQTSAQGIMQQLEAMQRAGMAPQQPAQLVEAGPGFDLSNPLDTGFFSGFQAKKAQQNQQPTTKIAAGGYIDDLLAENMTADDLLNLLR